MTYMTIVRLVFQLSLLFLGACSSSDPYQSGTERAVLLTDQLDLAFPGGYLREKTEDEYMVIVKRMEGNLIKETRFKAEDLDLYLQGFFDQLLVYHKSIQQKADDGQLEESPWKRKEKAKK